MSMSRLSRPFVIAWLSVAGLWVASAAHAEYRGPVVVELFTSQGCAACPPADEMIHYLSERDDVIALALHVDYWDYIGWKDVFARPEHTRRQQLYAAAAGNRMVYTPQVVIGGATHVVGTRPMEVMDAIAAHAAEGPGVHVQLLRSGDSLRIDAERKRDGLGEVVVLLVRFKPEETVMITRGENKGRTFTYGNIVTSMDVIGRWRGPGPMTQTVPLEGDASAAVLMQQPNEGRIVGAAQLK